MNGSQGETRRLRRNVEWALRRALDPATVLPMLHRLSRLTAHGSDENLYAQRRLAELLVDQDPWRAALSAKRVLAVQPTDDGAWAILALCHALLGNYRCAVSAYRRALAQSPENAAYAHNLGHLVDVALGRPREALPWLRVAYDLTERRADVAVSFAHALGRAGELEEAKRVSRRALRAKHPENLAEHLALAEWLEGGAVSEPKLLPRRPPARAVRSPWKPVARGSRRSSGEGRVGDARTEALDGILAKGLASLPLDGDQRTRARAFARDPAIVSALIGDDPLMRTSLAAAIAYAVVFIDGVSLTQAEVAACFRVSVPALRGQFKALRARIDLAPAGGQVATKRPR